MLRCALYDTVGLSINSAVAFFSSCFFSLPLPASAADFCCSSRVRSVARRAFSLNASKRRSTVLLARPGHTLHERFCGGKRAPAEKAYQTAVVVQSCFAQLFLLSLLFYCCYFCMFLSPLQSVTLKPRIRATALMVGRCRTEAACGFLFVFASDPRPGPIFPLDRTCVSNTAFPVICRPPPPLDGSRGAAPRRAW